MVKKRQILVPIIHTLDLSVLKMTFMIKSCIMIKPKHQLRVLRNIMKCAKKMKKDT